MDKLNRLIGMVMPSKCAKTARVRVMKQIRHSHLRKSFFKPFNYLCDDYLSSTTPGDIVTIVSNGVRTSCQKHHVVDEIVSAFRTGEERIQPEGVKGWLKRREEEVRRKVLRRMQREAKEGKKPGEGKWSRKGRELGIELPVVVEGKGEEMKA